MHKTISTLIIIVFFLALTIQPMPVQAGEGKSVEAYVVPTEYGAEIHTGGFEFVEQPIEPVCFFDYCYMVVKRGDPTPQPN